MGRATGAKAQARGPFLWRAVKGVGFPRRRFPLEEGVPTAVRDPGSLRTVGLCYRRWAAGSLASPTPHTPPNSPHPGSPGDAGLGAPRNEVFCAIFCYSVWPTISTQWMLKERRILSLVNWGDAFGPQVFVLH